MLYNRDKRRSARRVCRAKARGDISCAPKHGEQRTVGEEAVMPRVGNIRQLEGQEHRLWHLIERVQRLSMRRARPIGSPWRINDVSRGQGRVLMTLKLMPEVSQKELTEIMGMRQQSLAELLGKLEGKGFVERTPSPNDRRKMMVRITPVGREEAEKLENAVHGERLSFFDCLNEDEKNNLEDYLMRIAAELEKASSDERRGPGR